MQRISKHIVLCVLLFAGSVKSQDSLRITLQMNSDTIKGIDDLIFSVTIQSTYPEYVLIAPSADNGVINDTSRFIFYQLLRKEGKDYEVVIPFGVEVEYPGRKIIPDTLTPLKPISFTDRLRRYPIEKGKYFSIPKRHGKPKAIPI